MIGQALSIVFHVAFVLMLAPLVTGFNRTLKARVQTRRGPGLLQPYRDLYKLLRKGMVIPDTASWIFTATPFVLFVSTLLASLLIPSIMVPIRLPWITFQEALVSQIPRVLLPETRLPAPKTAPPIVLLAAPAA